MSTKIKKIAVIVSLAVLIIVSLAVSVSYSNRYYVGIKDDGIYFGMSAGELQSVKGEPTEIWPSQESPQVIYSYEEKLLGRDFRVSYTFLNSHSFLSLMDVTYSLDTLSYNDAKQLCEQFESDNCVTKYGTRSGEQLTWTYDADDGVGQFSCSAYGVCKGHGLFYLGYHHIFYSVDYDVHEDCAFKITVTDQF